MPTSPNKGRTALVMIAPDDYQVVVGFTGPVDSRLPGISLFYSPLLLNTVVGMARLMEAGGVKPAVHLFERAGELQIVVYFKLYASFEQIRSIAPDTCTVPMTEVHQLSDRMCLVNIAESGLSQDWYMLIDRLYREKGYVVVQLVALGDTKVVWETKVYHLNWGLPDVKGDIQGLE